VSGPWQDLSVASDRRDPDSWREWIRLTETAPVSGDVTLGLWTDTEKAHARSRFRFPSRSDFAAVLVSLRSFL